MLRIGLLSLITMALVEGAALAKTFRLYYLGGQSNMDGLGQTKDLDQSTRRPVPGVYIFHGNPVGDGRAADGRGLWAPLQPGHGMDFGSDGKTNRLTPRFGIELSFGRRLKELQPDLPIALIKYSRKGTAIDCAAADRFGCWDPDFTGGEGPGKGINQYDHFLATLRNAMAVSDIDGDGSPDTLIPAGIVWMQGESDADVGGEETARRYGAHLKRLMNLIRAALRVDDLPIAIGRISDSRHNAKPQWAHGPWVRAAQEAFCREDGAAFLVTSTDRYKYSDPWHYDSAGYLDLGKQFAEALTSLQRR